MNLIELLKEDIHKCKERLISEKLTDDEWFRLNAIIMHDEARIRCEKKACVNRV